MILTCKSCNSPVEIPESLNVPLRLGVLCESCLRVRAERDDHADEQRRLTERWLLICPERFQDTAVGKLPCQPQAIRALSWQRNGDGHGLNLWGFPNTGKTRSMFLVLKREHFAWAKVRVFTAGEFERNLEWKAWRRASWVDSLIRCDVLAFDDFDKMTLTKDGERVFFGILDRRMAEKRPVLLTHNSTAATLEYRFRYCGEAMVRRIRDFCESVHFPERQYELRRQ